MEHTYFKEKETHRRSVEAEKTMEMSFPQSVSGNPEDKKTGFRDEHGMTGRRGFSGERITKNLSSRNWPLLKTENRKLKTVFMLFALLMMALPAFQGFIAWEPSLTVALSNASSEVTIVGFMGERVEKTAN